MEKLQIIVYLVMVIQLQPLQKVFFIQIQDMLFIFQLISENYKMKYNLKKSLILLQMLFLLMIFYINWQLQVKVLSNSIIYQIGKKSKMKKSFYLKMSVKFKNFNGHSMVSYQLLQHQMVTYQDSQLLSLIYFQVNTL